MSAASATDQAMVAQMDAAAGSKAAPASSLRSACSANAANESPAARSGSDGERSFRLMAGGLIAPVMTFFQLPIILVS